VGKKVALGVISTNWKYKEAALKIIYKQTEKSLSKQQPTTQESLEGLLKCATSAVSSTCREKVIKVFNVALSLFNLIVSSTQVERGGVETLKKGVTERDIVLRLLQKSEEGNTRVTNKIHEALLDFSFHPKIGEAQVTSFVLARITAHNRAGGK